MDDESFEWSFNRVGLGYRIAINTGFTSWRTVIWLDLWTFTDPGAHIPPEDIQHYCIKQLLLIMYILWSGKYTFQTISIYLVIPGYVFLLRKDDYDNNWVFYKPPNIIRRLTKTTAACKLYKLSVFRTGKLALDKNQTINPGLKYPEMGLK